MEEVNTSLENALFWFMQVNELENCIDYAIVHEDHCIALKRIVLYHFPVPLTV